MNTQPSLTNSDPRYRARRPDGPFGLVAKNISESAGRWLMITAGASALHAPRTIRAARADTVPSACLIPPIMPVNPPCVTTLPRSARRHVEGEELSYSEPGRRAGSSGGFIMLAPFCV